MPNPSYINIRSCARILLLALLLATSSSSATAEPADSTAVAATDSTRHGGSLWHRLMTYLAESSKPKPDKRIDFGLIGGPHFSSDAGLGLGLVASGLYSTNRADSLLPQSNISLYSDITTKGFMLIGLRGNHFFASERARMDYKLYVYTFPSYFWGIGYDNGDDDANKSKYRRLKMSLMARYLWRVGGKAWLGPMIDYQFMRAGHLENRAEALLEGADRTVRSYSAGLSFMYDTRDFMLNATRGWFVQLDALASPCWIGNSSTYFTADLTMSTYRRLWRTGVLAGEIHTRYASSHTPWTMLSEVGSSDRMRGYYAGRYRDRDIIEAQVELRQRVWKRHGMVVWIAAANVFPQYSEIHWKQTLPCAGLGYRWEFKKQVNIRLDYGLSRNGSGFIFNINEAF